MHHLHNHRLLGNNSLHGPLPDAWQHLQQLEELQLQGNSLTFTLPSAWGIMASLEVLQLQGNALTGPLPSSWGGMHALQVRGQRQAGIRPLAGCKLNGICSGSHALLLASLLASLPSAARGRPAWLLSRADAAAVLLRHQALHLDRNALASTLPEAWGRLGMLSTLTARSAGLAGTLPPAWKDLHALLQL